MSAIDALISLLTALLIHLQAKGEALGRIECSGATFFLKPNSDPAEGRVRFTVCATTRDLKLRAAAAGAYQDWAEAIARAGAIESSRRSHGSSTQWQADSSGSGSDSDDRGASSRNGANACNGATGGRRRSSNHRFLKRAHEKGDREGDVLESFFDKSDRLAPPALQPARGKRASHSTNL